MDGEDSAQPSTAMREANAMEKIKLERDLNEAQIEEIRAARDLPYVEDEDNPQLDPETTPELWAELMNALAERNRRMAERMA